MTSPERLQAIQSVHAALDAVATARADMALSVDERGRLDRAYVELDRIESSLMSQELNDRLDALRAGSEQLGTLTDSIKRDAAKLAAIAERIDQAAKAVATLVDVAAKASSAGLV